MGIWGVVGMGGHNVDSRSGMASRGISDGPRFNNPSKGYQGRDGLYNPLNTKQYKYELTAEEEEKMSTARKKWGLRKH